MPGFIGMPEILLLGLLALLLFGPKKLPEMGRGLGKGLREFKESVTGDNKDGHGFTESKLDPPHELTATPIATEPVAPVAAPSTPVDAELVAEHRNVA